MKLSEAWFLLNGAANFVAYVVIDQLTDNYDFINTTTLGNQCNILAKIQNYTAGTNYYVIYQDPTNYRTRVYTTNLTNLHITLCDNTWAGITPTNDWECVIDLIITKKKSYEKRNI